MIEVKAHLKYIVLCALALLVTTAAHAEGVMRVQGVVTSGDSRKPIADVIITNNSRWRGESNQDGRYSIMATPGEELLFHMSGYDDVTITIGREQIVNVVLSPRVLSVAKIVVSGRARRRDVVIDPPSVEVDGNYLDIKTNIKIPRDKLDTDSRLILQPRLHDLTQDRLTYLRPLVIDGKNYKVVTHRYMNFGEMTDSLARYVVDDIDIKNNNVYTYQDSLYVGVKSLDNKYKIYYHLVVGSYDPPIRYSDTLALSIGTINPLRFFDKSVGSMPLDESKIAPPEPDLELYNTRGVANIEFEMGQSRINYNRGDNRESIDRITDIISVIESDSNATLKSIKMRGYASPEGGERTNKVLADRRTQEMMRVVTSALKTSHMEYIYVDAEGVVEPWSRLIDIAKEEGNEQLSEKLQSIITRAKGSYPSTQHLVLRLPEYQKTIKPHYLPRLRRVEYEVDYTVFRPLTIEEVREKYARGDQQLARSEYYLMIGEERDSLRRVEYERSAIEEYPNFLIYLNREAVRLIESDSVDLELLDAVMESDDLPQEVIYNQTAMLLMANRYYDAWELSKSLVMSPETEHIINVCRLYSHEYAETFDYFKSRGGLNEVLILLRERSNREAYDKMMALYEVGDNSRSAKMNYVIASCAARMDDLRMATHYLGRAIELEPSLSDIAMGDADVADIYTIIKKLRDDATN